MVEIQYFLVQKFHGTQHLTTVFIEGRPVDHILGYTTAVLFP
jgi:hypothetical protein